MCPFSIAEQYVLVLLCIRKLKWGSEWEHRHLKPYVQFAVVFFPLLSPCVDDERVNEVATKKTPVMDFSAIKNAERTHTQLGCSVVRSSGGMFSPTLQWRDTCPWHVPIAASVLIISGRIRQQCVVVGVRICQRNRWLINYTLRRKKVICISYWTCMFEQCLVKIARFIWSWLERRFWTWTIEIMVLFLMIICQPDFEIEARRSNLI